jgi:hypothetical protein
MKLKIEEEKREREREERKNTEQSTYFASRLENRSSVSWAALVYCSRYSIFSTRIVSSRCA